MEPDEVVSNNRCKQAHSQWFSKVIPSLAKAVMFPVHAAWISGSNRGDIKSTKSNFERHALGRFGICF
jgi:hypothetical protein